MTDDKQTFDGPPIDPPCHGDPDRPRPTWDRTWRRLRSEGRTWTPWLVLRHNQTDQGFRPVPPGTETWHCPDIWVESSLGYSDKAIVGEANHVHARIINIGRATALPAQVDFYWGDPTFALVPGNLVHIGSEWVTVPRESATDVRCSKPWYPVLVNGGHECLVVNCNAFALDRITAPFYPTLDRHVGQRNIAVVEGGPGESIPFRIFVNNPFPLEMRTTIALRTEHVALAPDALETLSVREAMNHVLQVGTIEHSADTIVAQIKEGTRERVTAERTATRLGRGRPPPKLLAYSVGEGRGGARVSARWDDHQATIWNPQGRSQLAQFLSVANQLTVSREAERSAISQVALLPNEQRRLALDLWVPPGARRGEYVVFHLAQRMAEIDVGGYSVVIQIGRR